MYEIYNPVLFQVQGQGQNKKIPCDKNVVYKHGAGSLRGEYIPYNVVWGPAYYNGPRDQTKCCASSLGKATEEVGTGEISHCRPAA